MSFFRRTDVVSPTHLSHRGNVVAVATNDPITTTATECEHSSQNIPLRGGASGVLMTCREGDDAMPPLVGLVLLGAGIYYAARFAKREMTRVGERMREANAEPRPIEIRLTRDPRTGVYRDPRG
jgi:hypothetical protein